MFKILSCRSGRVVAGRRPHQDSAKIISFEGMQFLNGGREGRIKEKQTNDFTDLCWNQSVCISVVFAVIYLEAFF